MNPILLRSSLAFVIAVVAMSFTFAPGASAQEEVAKGSTLRKELFALARPQIEAAAGRAVLFEGSMKRLGTWVFFSGTIVTAAGQPIRLGPAESADTALLWSLQKGLWSLREAEVGFTDVIYLDWCHKHGFPRALTGP